MGWPDSVTLTVEVSWTGPLDTPSWVDISAYVKSIDIAVGRTRELTPFPAGRATIVLDNSARRFDPLHATGPYYGDLLPNRPIRVTATKDATDYELFHGFVDGWPQNYSPPSDATTTVVAHDAFKLLGNMDVPASVYAAEVLDDTPWGWWRFLDATGAQWTDASGNDRHARLEAYSTTYGDTLRTVADVTAEADLLYEGGRSIRSTTGAATLPAGLSSPMSVEFWFRGRIDFAGGAIIPAVYMPHSSAAGFVEIQAGKVRWWFSGGSNYVKTTNECIPDDTLAHVVLTKNGTTVHIYVNGVDQALTTTGSVTFLDTGVQWIMAAQSEVSTTGPDSFDDYRIAEFALYSTDLSAARVAAHYAAGINPWEGDTADERAGKVLDLVGWPSGASWRDLDACATAMAPARLDGNTKKALDVLNRIAATEQGLLYIDHANGGKVRLESRHERFTASRSTTSRATITDATSGTYRFEDIELRYDEADVVNVVKVKWANGTVEASDATSIGTYGRKAIDIDTELPDAADAAALGDWVLARYKDPTVRCRSLSLNPAAAVDGFDVALDARISDRFTYRRLPQNTGSAIERDVIIEGIEHHIAQGVNRWETKLLCSEADATAYWVWGTSTWGETTRWGW